MNVGLTSSEQKLFLHASLDQMSFELTSFEQSYSKQMLLEQRMPLPMTNDNLKLMSFEQKIR